MTWRACAGAQHDLATPFQRLRGIAHDVEYGLDQLLPIASNIGQAGVVIAFHSHVGKLGKNKGTHLFEDFMDADRLRLHQSVRTEQPVHQFLQAIGLLDDDLGVFVQLRIGQFPLEQLRRTTDATQRILDFMSEIADQLTIDLLLLSQALFPRRLQLLVNMAKLQQQTDVAGFHRGDSAVQMQWLDTMPAPCRKSPCRMGREVLPGIAPIVGQRIIERGGQSGRLTQQQGQRSAQHLPGADRKEIFRCGIKVLDDQCGIQQDDGRGEQV